MSDKSAQNKCSCGGHSTSNGASQTAGEQLAKIVRAQVPQDYDANFRIRLVPARTLESNLRLQPHCMPRGHVPSGDPSPFMISPDLAATLSKADKVMISWLARDTANAQRYLADPVAALREAGVELSRAEEKALARDQRPHRVARP